MHPARLACVCVLAANSLLGCASEAKFPPSSAHTLLGRKLPAFRRVTLDGQVFDSAALGKKPLVLKFFAEYCEPCKRTLPILEKLHNEHADVTFLGVSEDDSTVGAARIKQRYELSFPIVHDAGHVLSGRFRIVELPLTVVVDEFGVVRWVGGPAQTEEQLTQAVTAISR